MVSLLRVILHSVMLAGGNRQPEVRNMKDISSFKELAEGSGYLSSESTLVNRPKASLAG